MILKCGPWPRRIEEPYTTLTTNKGYKGLRVSGLGCRGVCTLTMEYGIHSIRYKVANPPKPLMKP